MSMLVSALKLATARPNPPKHLQALARPIGIPLIILSILTIYALVAGRVVLNATESLAARGFYVVVWPKPLIRGSVVVVTPPEALADKFEGLLFTKRLIGLPGDEITHVAGQLCIKDRCVERAHKDGEPFGNLTEPGIIPSGKIAIFGETSTSLDSRYARVGLFSRSDIQAVGFAIPGFPAWQDLRERIGS